MITSTATRFRLLAAAIAATMTLTALAVAPVQATTRGDGLRAAANERRQDAGVDPVQGTSLLDDIADKRADQMRDARKLEHDMDYVRWRLNKADACWTSFGEIIAWRSGGTYSYEGTITQWMNSTPHREIMLGSGFNAAGGSWATASDGGHYSVMIFVTLCGSELKTSTSSLLKPGREYSPDRPMILVKGTHTAYKFSSTGKVLDTKTITLDRRRSPESTGRTKLDGVAYLKVSSGRLDGYWVRESPRQFVRGTTEKHIWSSSHTVWMADGTYTGFRFDKLGRVTAKKTRSLPRNWRYEAAGRAVINGRDYFLMDEGKWDGYWIRDTSRVKPVR
jgi:uncharacterized protein YkwD